MKQRQDGTVPGSSNGEVRADFRPEPTDPDQKGKGGATERPDVKGSPQEQEELTEEE